jgi:hypothetical protein
LIRSQYNIPEKDMVILAPPVYQQLLERMLQHLQNTTFARNQADAALKSARPRRRTARQQEEQQPPEDQRQEAPTFAREQADAAIAPEGRTRAEELQLKKQRRLEDERRKEARKQAPVPDTLLEQQLLRVLKGAAGRAGAAAGAADAAAGAAEAAAGPADAGSGAAAAAAVEVGIGNDGTALPVAKAEAAC